MTEKLSLGVPTPKGKAGWVRLREVARHAIFPKGRKDCVTSQKSVCAAREATRRLEEFESSSNPSICKSESRFKFESGSVPSVFFFVFFFPFTSFLSISTS